MLLEDISMFIVTIHNKYCVVSSEMLKKAGKPFDIIAKATFDPFNFYSLKKSQTKKAISAFSIWLSSSSINI